MSSEKDKPKGMGGRFLDWLDDRTGVRKIWKEVLYEPVPGGARWRYVWGSTLTFGLFIQFVTGIALWAAYSPSSQTAWESVYYIQTQMSGGWILRGIHHYTAQVMTVLLVLHLMQIVIDGAYKAPREINFWFGMLLLFLIGALSLTGYLLPWDQKGYWSTKVATNLVGIVPIVGPSLQNVVVGGSDYGHHTLTRFFALHAGVLPALTILLVVGHVYLFRRHGLKAKEPIKKKDGMFWPDQIWREVVACGAVLLTVLALVFWHHGAALTAPADPSERFPARPDWYFLFLFEFLKYFKGSALIIGGIIIPGIVALIIFAMPITAQKWKWGHKFNLYFLWGLLVAFGILTALAIVSDKNDPEYQFAKKLADQDAARVRELASSPEGIAPVGAAVLLREDPLTQGPRIFASKCASCHSYGRVVDEETGKDLGPNDGLGRIQKEPSAPDLKGFGSRQWLADFMDTHQIETDRFFYGTKFVAPDEKGKKSRMVEYVHELANIPRTGQLQLQEIIKVVSAEAELPAQHDLDLLLGEDPEGVDLFFTGIDGMSEACGDCHGFDGEESMAARTPDLTGWASRDWTIRFTKNPEHADFYGSGNDRMPIFEEERIFTDREIELVVDWIRGDYIRYNDDD